ncbi:MAG: transporter substrate-binding domain-containing protein [Oscillospiraceae bacterium]|jgi:putative glutamine transport system substrate-binding protein|nr:transporter substrate-binding domain-containing protein [Oscillospiraceae bacterium]
MKKAFVLSIVALLLTLAGCAGGSSATPTPTPTPTPPSAPAAGTDVTDEAPPLAGDALPAEVQAIADRGVLRVGVKVDVPQFGYLNPDTNEQEGMEADLARELARRIVGDESAVEFQAVTAKTRGPLLDNEEVDMVIATFTITEERKLSYNFTQPYFVDGIGFLVKRDLGALTIADLDGKTVAVAQSATTKDALDEKAAELGITFQYSEYASYPEAKTALTSGRVDAFSVDKSILLGYVDDTTVILEETFKPQEYGIASKLDKTELAAYLDDFISEIKTDGTLDALVEKWAL